MRMRELAARAGITVVVIGMINACGGSTEPKVDSTSKSHEEASQTGRVSFWTDYSGSIGVSVDGTPIGTTSTPYQSSPDCGAAGTVTATLTVGTHTYSAASGSNTWSGTVSIGAGECTLYKLPAPASAAVGRLSIWTNYTTPIGVSIDGGAAGNLTTYFTTPPSCGQAGTLTTTLLPGSHAIAGVSGPYTWDGTAIVIAGQCTLYELNAPASAPSTGTLSIWTDYPTQIALRVDGNSVGATSSYFPTSTPTCGQSGTVNLTLPAGVHTVSGSSGQTTWNGTATVTAGQCTLYKLSAPSSGGSGTLSIWTNYGTQITVRVDGTPVGTTTTYFPNGAPTCGQNGTITISVSAGLHSVTAVSGSYTWNGTATVVSGECTLYELRGP